MAICFGVNMKNYFLDNCLSLHQPPQPTLFIYNEHGSYMYRITHCESHFQRYQNWKHVIPSQCIREMKVLTKFYSLEQDGCIKDGWLGKTFLLKRKLNIFWSFGINELMPICFEYTIRFKPALWAVRDVALFSISREQTQSNRVWYIHSLYDFLASKESFFFFFFFQNLMYFHRADRLGCLPNWLCLDVSQLEFLEENVCKFICRSQGSWKRYFDQG